LDAFNFESVQLNREYYEDLIKNFMIFLKLFIIQLSYFMDCVRS